MELLEEAASHRVPITSQTVNPEGFPRAALRRTSHRDPVRSVRVAEVEAILVAAQLRSWVLPMMSMILRREVAVDPPRHRATRSRT